MGNVVDLSTPPSEEIIAVIPAFAGMTAQDNEYPNYLKKEKHMNTSKKIVQILAIIGVMTVHGIAQGSAFGLQDVFLFGEITNETTHQVLNDQIIAHLKTDFTGTYSLPGGLTLTTTTNTGRVADRSSGTVRDSDGIVSMGIISFGGNENVVTIVSTYLSASEALGRDFNAELDLTGISNVAVGDTISHEYVSLHTYSTPTDPTGNDPFGVFVNRIEEGSFTAAGLYQWGVHAYDPAKLAMGFSVGEIISGSTFWRYFGKTLEVAGETLGAGIGGALGGAGVGAGIGAAAASPTGPGAAAGAATGAVIGGVVGGAGAGVAGFLHGVGGAIKDNNEIDPPRPIPEPATLLLFGTGLACLVGTRRKNK